MLGDKIKLLRKEKNLTQIQLAKQLNIAQSTLGMIESNSRPAGRKTLLKLAEYFNVSLDSLMDDEKKEVASSLTIREQENIDIKAQNIMDEMAISFSKNKELLTDEDYFVIENALRTTLEAIKIRNKNKFTPKKYK